MELVKGEKVHKGELVIGGKVNVFNMDFEEIIIKVYEFCAKKLRIYGYEANNIKISYLDLDNKSEPHHILSISGFDALTDIGLAFISCSDCSESAIEGMKRHKAAHQKRLEEVGDMQFKVNDKWFEL